ncbi:hypothetical protein J6590_051399 [Homalodisca vitripennis]|nr:hypothetical protein J6590_051399 [Homalodisca vitripennis]
MGESSLRQRQIPDAAIKEISHSHKHLQPDQRPSRKIKILNLQGWRCDTRRSEDAGFKENLDGTRVFHVIKDTTGHFVNRVAVCLSVRTITLSPSCSMETPD